MSLMKSDFEKDLVYLVQFPRATTLPNMSPFALKLETWLRMNNVKYEHVENSFTKMSSKGQIPFIELNGEQMADSNLIIEQLPAKLGLKNLDEPLSEQEKAQSRALHALIEDKMFWARYGLAGHEGRQSLEINGLLDNVPFYLKPVYIWRFQRYLTNRAYYHGIGRQTKEEMAHFFKDDVKALSVLLGTKPFMMGDKPTNVDATAFGHLAVAFLRGTTLPEVEETREYTRKNCPNIYGYMKRMVEKYYPDWKQLAPNSLPI